MKYLAPTPSGQAGSAWTGEPDAEAAAGVQIIDLVGTDVGLVPAGSRRWLGVLIALAAAVTGFGFVSHGSEIPLLEPARAPAAVGILSAERPTDAADPTATARATLDGAEPPVAIIAPSSGATVTSGVTITGAVLAVDATARRPLGSLHASVTMGELVLGSSDVEVRVAGPVQFRIPLFPPPFKAAVVLRMQAAAIDGGSDVDVSRDFDLAIPSVVGFWDATPTGKVDGDGRRRLLVRGYGPLSARTVDLSVRDARGQDLATASGRLAVDGNRPGAVAGRILGLGSFEVELWLPAGSEAPASLLGTWRDAATGARLHMETSLTAP